MPAFLSKRATGCIIKNDESSYLKEINNLAVVLREQSTAHHPFGALIPSRVK